MKQSKSTNLTIIKYACAVMPAFSEAWEIYIRQIALEGRSNSLRDSYGRMIAKIVMHFNQLPQHLCITAINEYLHQLILENPHSRNTFRHTVFGLRYWFKIFDCRDKQLQLPEVKYQKKLPTVLNKKECQSVLNSPKSFKQRFILAFIYSTGIRVNEARHVMLYDIDVTRKLVYIREGKGKKDRYVILADKIIEMLPKYLKQYQPTLYLIENGKAGEQLSITGLRWIFRNAVKKSGVQKPIRLHTFRHSFATHLLEDGLDVHSIQKLLGHANITSTLIYLQVTNIVMKRVHSPLDTLYH